MRILMSLIALASTAYCCAKLSTWFLYAVTPMELLGILVFLECIVCYLFSEIRSNISILKKVLVDSYNIGSGVAEKVSESEFGNFAVMMIVPWLSLLIGWIIHLLQNVNR